MSHTLGLENAETDSDDLFWPLTNIEDINDPELPPIYHTFHDRMAKTRQEWATAKHNGSTHACLNRKIFEANHTRVKFAVDLFSMAVMQDPLPTAIPHHPELSFLSPEALAEAEHRMWRDLRYTLSSETAEFGKIADMILSTSRYRLSQLGLSGITILHRFPEANDPDCGDHKVTLIGGMYGQKPKIVYRVQCGPLRCGQRDEDDGCPHGMLELDERPPGWEEGIGWAHGNCFQVKNQGVWYYPRYRWDGDVRSGPYVAGDTNLNYVL